MNAASAPVPNSKAAEQRAHEPSMEEILASIRKIIADDQVLPLSGRQPQSSADLSEDAEDPVDNSWRRPPVQEDRHREAERIPELRMPQPRVSTPPRESAQEPQRRPQDAPQLRGPLDFHTSLASIFANDRVAPQAAPPQASSAPVPEPSAARQQEAVRQIPVGQTPQLVAKAVAPVRDAPPQPVAAVVLPIDMDRARPASGDARHSSQDAQPVQDNRPAPYDAAAEDGSNADQAYQRRDPSAGAAVVREMRASQASAAPRRDEISDAPPVRLDVNQPDLMRDERREPPRQRPVQAEVAQPEAAPRRPAAERSGNSRHDFMREETPRYDQPRAERRDDSRSDFGDHLAERLLSDDTDASVSSAFQALTTSIALPDPEVLESVTRELLRPMLKQWLDDNLPVMVEKLVRAEIERVARGPR